MIKRFWSFINQSFVKQSYRIENFSPHLGRNVLIDILLPPRFRKMKSYPIIIFNDGQDFPALNIKQTVNDLYDKKLIHECIIVGIHCNDQRLYEYGTLDAVHYKGYGNKAHQYNQFIINELMPWLSSKYKINKNKITIAGFSLGALSALDIAWHNNPLFNKVGIFSAALWWRSHVFDEKNPDANRIMIETLQKGPKRNGLQFWFEVGTKDEEDDRNNNGVIDAIDDTKDAIETLLSLGYSLEDIRYTEIEGGEHNPQTWGYAMPEFLLWAIGK
jgi:iron(III)-enterobactin esterase